MSAWLARARERLAAPTPVPVVPKVPIGSPSGANGAIGTNGTTIPVTQDDPDAFEERAAVIQFDGGIARPWAEGLARLELADPSGISEARWIEILNDAGHFADRWSEEASSAEWTPERVFGASGAAGVIWLVNGRTVVAVSADRILVRDKGGALQAILRNSDRHER